MKKEIENAIKELQVLGASVFQVGDKLKLIGNWNEKYNKYHHLFIEITGSLDTSNALQHEGFLGGLTSLGSLDTSKAVQHEDFLSNLTSLGSLDTYHVVQHEDFLSNLTSLGSLNTSNAVQHEGFLGGLTSLGGLYTSDAVQHEGFLGGVKNTFDLPLIYADYILSVVKSTREVDGVKIHLTNRVGYSENEYIAEESGVFAHARTLNMALIDLRFKQSDRDTSWLKGKCLSDELSFSDAVLAYRCVTGACSGGVEGFLERHEQKDKYTISEVIEITRGEFGNKTFYDFFNQAG